MMTKRTIIHLMDNGIQLYDLIMHKRILGVNKHPQGNDGIHKRLTISKQMQLHKKE